jgi:hypothetical protein
MSDNTYSICHASNCLRFAVADLNNGSGLSKDKRFHKCQCVCVLTGPGSQLADSNVDHDEANIITHRALALYGKEANRTPTADVGHHVEHATEP